MAVVLDVNILCNKMLDLNRIMPLLSRYQVSIESASNIDNWMWDNEKKLDNYRDIVAVLDMRRIVIIRLEQPLIKDMGIYIEKIENQFLYTLWINTEGYPMLDCEKITKDNNQFSKKIIQDILEINELLDDFFEVLGIGLETDFCYDKNLIDIIRNSKNVMIWMLNKRDELDVKLEGFKFDIMEGMRIWHREDI